MLLRRCNTLPALKLNPKDNEPCRTPEADNSYHCRQPCEPFRTDKNYRGAPNHLEPCSRLTDARLCTDIDSPRRGPDTDLSCFQRTVPGPSGSVDNPTSRMSRYILKTNIEDRTTVVMLNVPIKYTLSMLMAEVAEENPKFNLVYLPYVRISKKTSARHRGYVFINFITPVDAQMFLRSFDGRHFQHQAKKSNRAKVSYAVMQGYKQNLQFFTKSKVAESLSGLFFTDEFPEPPTAEEKEV